MKKEEKYVNVYAHYHENEKSDNMKRWEKSLPAKWWEYRKKWEQSPKQLKIEPFPINLDVEITGRCNLMCTICSRTFKLKHGRLGKQGDMEMSLFKRLVDEGAQNGLYALNLNGFGEPLLHKDLPEMIAYAKKKGIIDTMFHTNATLLDEEKAAKLIEAGLDKIIFSFDSPSREQYESIRVGAKYDEVVQNIRNFVRIRNEMGSMTPIVRLTMVVMKDNAGKKQDFLRMWKGMADIITFQDYLNMLKMDRDDRHAVQLVRHDNFVCPQLFQRLQVYWDGLVAPCCTEINRELILGDAKKESIKSIWNGGKLNALRKMHLDGKWDSVPVCNRCELPYL